MAAPRPRLTLATASSAPSAAAGAEPSFALKASALSNAAAAAQRTSSFPAAGLPTLTTSSCTTEVEEGKHLFDVNRYGSIKDLGVGMFVKSGTFDVGGYSWALLFYPAGSEAAPAGERHVSFYLQLVTPNVEVLTVFDLRLMDQYTGRWHSLLGDAGDRPRRHALFSTFPTKPLADAGKNWWVRTLPPHHPPRCWGVPSWKASNLETPAYIQNGSLTIRCDISVVKPPCVPETKPLTWIKEPPPGLSKDFRKLLEEKEGKDVTVHVGGEAFLAHWTVLAARSPVLRKKLCDATGEAKPSSVAITMEDDMEPAVFKAMLHFIYTDELPPDMEGCHDGGEEAAEFVRRLFIAAEGCGIERLKGLCESLLYRNLNKRTLKATMEFAGQHRCDKLREACVQFSGFKRGPAGASASARDSEACKRLKTDHAVAGVSEAGKRFKKK